MNTFVAENICRATFWERISGWEVVAAVLIICAYWALVSVARSYFLWKASTSCPHQTDDL